MDEAATPQSDGSPFTPETQQLLRDYLQNLPRPVHIHMWGDPRATTGEREAARLLQSLSQLIDPIQMAIFPRRENYPYYPVLGIISEEPAAGALIDHGLRFIGLPAGVQITALIAAIQAVAFSGATLEAKTRVQLTGLADDATLELLTAAEDELGAIVAKNAFAMAAFSDHVRTYVIMADVFPEALWKHSARHVPHLVINGRVHLQGNLSEEDIVRGIAKVVKRRAS